MAFNRMYILLVIGIIGFSMTACGPSQEEMDATETKVAFNIFATQTAKAPTQTPTPTITPSPPAPSSATPTPSPTITPTFPEPEALFDIARERMGEVDTYHFEMMIEMTVKDGGMTMEVPFEIIGDIATPDHMSGVFIVKLMGISIEVGLVVIGERIYMTDPETGEWMLVPPEEAFYPMDPNSITEVMTEDFSDLVVIGMEDFENTPVYHLRGTIPGEAVGLSSGDFLADYWIGVEDNLIYKSEVSGEVEMEEESLTDEDEFIPTNIHATITLSNFNAPITIEAPVVVPAP